MRKSLIVLALLVGALAMWTTWAAAAGIDEGAKLMNARMAQQQLTRAARLGTSAASDTFWIGHSSTLPYSLPYHVGVGPHRPGVGGAYNGMWDFDTYDGGALDTLQGWVPTVSPNTRSAGTIPDTQRPWQCLDYGNRMNATPIQGRTIGIVGAWHTDDGVNAGPASKPLWAPLSGTGSAWCGLRSGDDHTYVDDVARGGTGVAIDGETLIGVIGDGVNNTSKNFPGYASQWDQMLYRDVRVQDGAGLTVSFKYETFLDNRTNSAPAACRGWFDKDPLSMGAGNFISATNYLTTPPGLALGPIDSFMVYVGCPTDPTATFYTDDPVTPRPIYDLKRRWFSEVIAINKPYTEILSTYGVDQAHAGTALSVSLPNGVIQPMLDAQPGLNGVIRVVFRLKTNAGVTSDEYGTASAVNFTEGHGGVRVDDVTINGGGANVVSGFEAAAEIDNRIEPANAGSPSVGEGYALNFWKSTGKPPKIMAHAHPMDGGGPSGYAPLAYADMCGAWDSPIRQCNINNVIISSTDHDLGEAAGGALGTPFKENRSGFVSPTINWVTPATGINNIGLDRIHATSADDWWFYYDIYTGIFNVTTQGNVWGNSALCWPTVQKNNATVWGDIGFITGVWYNPDKQCFLMNDLIKPCLYTSNESGYPDSMKIWIFREQRCISWNVTTGCSPTDGHYTDNISVCLPPPPANVTDKIAVDIWDWYGDAFPRNETAGLPGTAAFDTCGALIQTARNQAANTGNTLRFDVPGDSIYVKTTLEGTLGDGRLDFVFRVFPGPGNYVIVGNKASGLRKVPSSTAPVVSGDNSFFGQFLANNGQFGTPGGHGGSWNVNVWNSAECDTTELNIFPCDGRLGNLSGLAVDQYMTTLHENDPHYAALGILKNKCFLVDTAGSAPINSTNITCSTVPAWVTDRPGTGYDGNQQTKEFTKIIPDGLLTAGSSVQYFFRLSRSGDAYATPSALDPDTNRITPQVIGSASNFDAKRWETIFVLPDRWKDAAYGGLGSACMLVADYNDRRGDEKVWVGAMDSIGGTAAAKFGAHNGWHATAAFVSGDGSHDFTGDVVTNNNNICVYTNGGQPGTVWDLYNIHAAESSNTGSAQIGSRLANRADMGYLTGKQSMQGPTPDMMRAYYKLLFIMSGDLNTSFFGMDTDRGQDDIALVENFLTYNANPSQPRGVWAMGHGFAEAMNGGTAQMQNFLNNTLAASLRDPSYYALSGTTKHWPDLTSTSVISVGGAIYTVENSCLFTDDVLQANSGGVTGAVAGDFYEPLGTNYPYIASVYAPSTSGLHPFVSLLSGFDMWNLLSRGAGNTVGRLQYFMNVMSHVFGSVCPFTPTPGLDVPPMTVRNVDFLGNIMGNPMTAGGKAIVRFGLAQADRVQVKVYDVTGRLVRTLADRNFQAGEQRLTWDGTNDQGQVVARGVYFTQVKYINSRFEDAKKVTVLK